jgi:MoaA/NifB/PqqE/SkfB family radical SAM enzyme
VHCCSDAGPHENSPELDAGSIRVVLDKAVLFGMDEFELSGGEPLVVERDSMLEILGHASGHRMLTTLNTNTWFLDERYALDLRDAGLDRLKTSLYGTSPRNHEEFTGIEGSFERLMHALELLRDMEIEVWVNYVVTPKNLDQTHRLAALLEPYDVDTIQVSAVVPTGRGRSAEEYVFSDQELYGVSKKLEEILPVAGHSNVSYTITLYPYPDRYPFGGRYCDYLTDRLVVDPSGCVLPCCVLPRDLGPSLGSLLEEDLPELLSTHRINGDPVFDWLARGHEAMEARLGCRRKTPNLCSGCIEMLRELVRGPAGGPG